jgi:FAD synthetase
MPENQRRALVESLRVVDAAVLGIEDFDIGEVIERVKPDVIALGYDQVDMERRVREYVNKHGLNVNVIRVGKFENDDMNSSSKIRKKILEKFAR